VTRILLAALSGGGHTLYGGGAGSVRTLALQLQLVLGPGLFSKCAVQCNKATGQLHLALYEAFSVRTVWHVAACRKHWPCRGAYSGGTILQCHQMHVLHLPSVRAMRTAS
jgi:hypothetical protein